MPGVLDWLKAQNAPADVIADAERGVMMHKDYTAKTQQLAYLVGQLQGQQQQQAPANAPRRHVDQVFEALGDDENGKALRSLFGPVVEAIYQDVDGTVGQENRQLKEALTRMMQSTRAKDALKEALVPKFGDKILAVLPELERHATQELLAGRPVYAEQALWDLFPDKATAALHEKQQQEEKQRQRSTLGGFEHVSRTSPPSGGAGGFGGAPPVAAAAGAGAPPKPDFDPVSMYHEIRDLIGTPASAGA